MLRLIYVWNTTLVHEMRMYESFFYNITYDIMWVLSIEIILLENNILRLRYKYIFIKSAD